MRGAVSLAGEQGLPGHHHAGAAIRTLIEDPPGGSREAGKSGLAGKKRLLADPPPIPHGVPRPTGGPKKSRPQTCPQSCR